MPSDILFSQVMIDAIEKEVVRRGSFFRDKFFPDVRLFPERTGQYDRIDHAVQKAQFAGYSGSAISRRMGSWDTNFFVFENCPISRTITADDLAQRFPGHSAYDLMDKAPELQRLSWSELEADAIYTEELLCVGHLKTGKTTIEDPQGVSKDLVDNSAEAAIVSGSFNIDLSTEGKAVAWINSLKRLVSVGGSYQGVTLAGKGASPNLLVVGSTIGDAITKAFSDGRAHAFDGQINPAADYADEGISYIGNIRGLDVYECADTNLLPEKGAVCGSAGASIMAYGPTYVKTEAGIARIIGRRSMYSEVSGNPAAVENILQFAPCPVARRPADNLYVVTTGTIS